MIKSLKLRAAIVCIVVTAAVIYLLPSVVPVSELPDIVRTYLPGGKLPLGLDLQGGTHLVLEVVTDKAV